MKTLAIAIIVLLGSLSSAQVMELMGGDSSILGGAGGGATAYFSNSAVSMSGGLWNGHPTFGASDSFLWKQNNIVAGTQPFGGIGFSLLHRSNDGNRTLNGFVGTEGLGYTTPYFAGSVPQHFGMSLSASQKVGRFRLTSAFGLVAGKHTLLSGVDYTALKLQSSFQAGLFEGAQYLTGQVNYTPLKYLRFSGSQSASFGVEYGTNVPLHVVSDGAGLGIGTSLLAGQFFFNHSDANGITANGESFSVFSHISFLTLSASLFRSGNRTSEMYVASQNLLRHFAVSETITTMDGKTNLQFGGGYTSNRFSVSLNQNMVFIPFDGHGFQRTTSITASVRIHDAVVNLANFVTNTGSIKFSAYGSSYVRGPLNVESSTSEHQFHNTGGKYVVRGVIRGKDGNTVEGIAIQIGKQLVFSNASGMVFTRTKHGAALTIKVVPEENVTPGHWQVVSAPNSVTPALEGHEQPFIIEVMIL